MLSFMYNILSLKQFVENIAAQYCLTVFKLIEIMFKLKDICCKITTSILYRDYVPRESHLYDYLQKKCIRMKQLACQFSRNKFHKTLLLDEELQASLMDAEGNKICLSQGIAP